MSEPYISYDVAVALYRDQEDERVRFDDQGRMFDGRGEIKVTDPRFYAKADAFLRAIPSTLEPQVWLKEPRREPEPPIPLPRTPQHEGWCRLVHAGVDAEWVDGHVCESIADMQDRAYWEYQEAQRQYQ